MPKITDLTSFQGTLSDTDVFPVVNSAITKKIPLSALRSNVLFGAAIPGSALVDQAVTTAKLADQAVTTAKLADQAVTQAKVSFSVSTLSYASPITWNLSGNQVAKVTLTGNTTVSNPTNKTEGAVYILAVIQDGTGNRTLSFGSDYKFPGNQAPTLTVYANAIDIFTFLCIGTKLYGTYVYQYQ
jgi:hypothetical protein